MATLGGFHEPTGMTKRLHKEIQFDELLHGERGALVETA